MAWQGCWTSNISAHCLSLKIPGIHFRDKMRNISTRFYQLIIIGLLESILSGPLLLKQDCVSIIHPLSDAYLGHSSQRRQWAEKPRSYHPQQPLPAHWRRQQGIPKPAKRSLQGVLGLSPNRKCPHWGGVLTKVNISFCPEMSCDMLCSLTLYHPRIIQAVYT